MTESVLLDTSFFIRFLNNSDPLFENADKYFSYFIDNNIAMLISTISIAEFCTGGSIDELPLRSVQILPFNLKHARRTGEIARIVFQNKGKLKLNSRNIIPNDTKLFAQADCETSITHYLSSDVESMKIYDLIKRETNIGFQFINLSDPHTKIFGELF
jgi:predicted nucleic acid-binding protein